MVEKCSFNFDKTLFWWVKPCDFSQYPWPQWFSFWIYKTRITMLTSLRYCDDSIQQYINLAYWRLSAKVNSPNTYPTESHRDTVKLCSVNCEFEFRVVQIWFNEAIIVFLKITRAEVPCCLLKKMEGELNVGIGNELEDYY